MKIKNLLFNLNNLVNKERNNNMTQVFLLKIVFDFRKLFLINKLVSYYYFYHYLQGYLN